MRILVVSYYTAWPSSVGSRRMNGLIRGLAADGHEVTVICAADPHRFPGEALDATIIATPPADRVLMLKRFAARLRRRPNAPHGSGAPKAGVRSSALSRSLRSWVGFPDTMWEWSYRAQRAARRVERPDLVLASAPPMAALHAAAAIARRAGCPWIADMRDLWTGDPYRLCPPVLRSFDRRLERSVLSSASAVTTVATSMADELQVLLPSTDIFTLRNGFDAAWIRSGDEPSGQPPTLVYTGTLTSNTGRSLDALCDLADQCSRLEGAPRIAIVGAVDRGVRQLVDQRGLRHLIHFHGVVSAQEARLAQHSAVALLNLSWENQRDYAKLPAKLFEYAAARRPVIHLGIVETLGTQLIRDTGLGFVVDPADPAAVAHLLVGLADGSSHWQPPSIDQLEPLSQAAMINGFKSVIAQVCAG